MATVDELNQPEGEPSQTPELGARVLAEASHSSPPDLPGDAAPGAEGDATFGLHVSDTAEASRYLDPEHPAAALFGTEPEAQAEEAIALIAEVPAEPASFGWCPSLTAIPLSLGWDAEPAVVDWFGTGAADLLISAAGGPRGRAARVFRPVAKAAGSKLSTYDAGHDVPGLDGLRWLCPIPNGAKSRFDLVALAPEGLVLLRNEGTATAPAFDKRESLGLAADLGFGEGQVAQMVSVDWDGDGLFDLLVGFDTMSGYWPDSALPLEQQVGLNQRGGHPGYDRRGLWRGVTPEGRLHWLQNVGTLGQPRFEPRPQISSDLEALELGMHPAPLAVAWGGGGGLELMAIDQRGMAKLYRNFGGQRPPVLMEPRSLTCGGAILVLPEDRTTVIAADIDGDRRVELVYGTSDGRVFAVHSGSGRDTATTPVALKTQPGDLRLGGRAVLTAGDLDGNGGLDLIYGDGPGRLHWLKDVGQGTAHRYLSPEAIEAAGETYQVDPGPDGRLLGPIAPKLGFAAPTLVDWLAHDRLDLVVGTAGGEVLVFANDGSKTQPRFAYPLPLKCSGASLITPPRVRPAVAFWADEPTSSPDLITLDLQGFLAVFPRVGTHEVGPPEPIVDRLGRLIRLDGGFGQGGRCALWAGDFTGSGRNDLLIGLPRDARYLLPALLGRGMSDLADWSTVVLLENVGHNTVIPRMVTLADGSPIILGTDGCSPIGVDASGAGKLDLLVGADDGSVHFFRRDQLNF